MPDDDLLSQTSVHYHRRKSVSRSCSGWEGVGPLRYGRQAVRSWPAALGATGRIGRNTNSSVQRVHRGVRMTSVGRHGLCRVGGVRGVTIEGTTSTTTIRVIGSSLTGN